jgi:hypothetical protein
MDPRINNPPPFPPPPPPARWSWPWFRAQFTAWWEQSTQHKCVQAIAGLLLIAGLLKCGCKFFIGLFFYLWTFAKAAILGDDILTESCARIVKETHPWWDLNNDDYFRLSRCLGNEHGFHWQGELIPSLGEITVWLFDPRVFSSWLVSILIPCSGRSLS